MRLRTWIYSFATLLSASAIANADLTISGYGSNPTRYDRFGGGSFIGNPYNFSGVGNEGLATANNSSPVAGTDHWATLISTSYVVSAFHFSPSNPLHFYSGNSPSGPVTYTITSGQQIGSTDLWLGKINRTATDAQTDGLVALPIAIDADYASSSSQIYVYGSPNRVGTNNVDLVANFTVGPSTGKTMFYDYDPGSGGNDEARVEGGDSGAPSFLIINGQLALVGVHWFQYADDNDPNITGSGDTYLPFYISALNGAMTGESVTVVPEPATMSLLVLGLLGMARRRR